MGETLSFEMTIAPGDFRRLLPGAAGGGREEDGAFVHREPGRSWTIRVAPLPPLTLGAIALERIRVDMVFQGYPDAEREACLERFRNHTRRGGG